MRMCCVLALFCFKEIVMNLIYMLTWLERKMKLYEGAGWNTFDEGCYISYELTFLELCEMICKHYGYFIKD